MRDLLERLTTKDPDVLWALVAIVVGYAIWGVLAGRAARRRTGGPTPAHEREDEKG